MLALPPLRLLPLVLVLALPPLVLVLVLALVVLLPPLALPLVLVLALLPQILPPLPLQSILSKAKKLLREWRGAARCPLGSLSFARPCSPRRRLNVKPPWSTSSPVD